jgi:hypothetical protein
MQSLVLVILASALITAGVAQQQPQSGAKTQQPCSEPEQKQLDFWIGSWDLTWPGNTAGEVAHGTNNIARMLDGCVVQENFSGGDAMPLRGLSVSLFNTRSGKWQQTWVDNQGAYLDFVGEFKDGQMILAREATKPDGSKLLQRMVYKNITPTEFDWSWESSSDGGKTWKVAWPTHYSPKILNAICAYSTGGHKKGTASPCPLVPRTMPLYGVF